MATTFSNQLSFKIGLRGFHFYKQTENWQPFAGQSVYFRRELDNEADRFAVAGLVRMDGRNERITVGHVPRELSRHFWHAILHGCTFSASVTHPRHKSSPLMQGGLEIELDVKAWWGDLEKLSILNQNVLLYNYPKDDYVDESKDILSGLHEIDVGDIDPMISENDSENDSENEDSEASTDSDVAIRSKDTTTICISDISDDENV